MSLFTNYLKESVAYYGEEKLIRYMREWLKEASPQSPQGIGDDCAIMDTSLMRSKLVTTVDNLVYRWHFDDKCCAKAAGAKLVKRNLSDIAAKGATPHHALVALLLPPNLKLTWLKSFYEGLREACEMFDLYIAGGDVSECPPGFFSASMTINGSADVIKPRSGASVGDYIYVTGDLGGSLHSKHINFIPRLKEGYWLAHQQEVTSMIDVTDGLSKDLRCILPSHGAAYLDLNNMPYSKECWEMAQGSAQKRFQHAFGDGEDYEILFTLASSSSIQAFEKSWSSYFTIPITCIGTVGEQYSTAKFVNRLTGKRLPRTSAYQHLKRS